MLRVPQAAQRLSVSRSTVYALCRQRLLRHVRVGAGRGSIRINEMDLEDYVARHRVEECDPRTMAANVPVAAGLAGA